VLSPTVTSAENAPEAVVPLMLVSADTQKKPPCPEPGPILMLLADVPEVHFSAPDEVVPDVSTTTVQALPSAVSST
jgi:hypothetical protein